MKKLLSSILLAAFALAAGPAPVKSPEKKEHPQRPLTEKTHHIGNHDHPDWEKFTTAKPEHHSYLRLRFPMDRTDGPFTLEVKAGGVGDIWKVRLNHKDLGHLKKGETAQVQYYEVPADLVKRGENELVVDCEKANVEDDIFVGPIVLHRAPLKDLLRLATVQVRVLEARTGAALPSRITVARLTRADEEKGEKKKDSREKEELVELRLEEKKEEARGLAVRRGIIYTVNGRAEFELPEGSYRLYATRGFEYGVAAAEITLEPDERRSVNLRLEHEVETPGYLAADTHIHTKTFSGHGDASIEERMVTIAGEGVEIAIATDHNHQTDYVPTARKAGVEDRFFSVVGNEFTTAIGHFNAFPLDKDAKPARHSSKDWTRLLTALRASPGVEVVICNHPRRGKPDEEAFNNIALDPVSGEAHQGPGWLGIDAVEVLNGKGLHEDKLLTFDDWFALLNRGLRLSAVAGSDSHTVEGIVGQTRTYVRCKAEKPSDVDLKEVTESFLKGRLRLCLGLLAEVKVADRYEEGDLATGLAEEIPVAIRVRGPRWARADDVALYLDGERIREERIEHDAGAITKFDAVWTIRRPRHDAHLVVIASGPPVTAPYWALPQEKRYLLGATNPVWLDGDGDGRFTSAYEYALKLTDEAKGEAARIQVALRDYDGAVAVQAASILRGRIQDELQIEYEHLVDRAGARLDALLTTSDRRLRADFDRYRKAAPALDVLTRREQTARALMIKKEKEKEEEEEKKAREKEEKERKDGKGSKAKARKEKRSRKV